MLREAHDGDTACRDGILDLLRTWEIGGTDLHRLAVVRIVREEDRHISSPRGTPLLCILPKMGLLDRAFAQPYRHATSDEYTSGLCTSWLLSPTLLFAYRLLISLYAFVVLFFILGWESTHNASAQAEQSFSYFTVLTYWGLAFYFAFAAAHTASYAWRGRPWLQAWPGWVRYLHSVYYSAVTVYPFIVTGACSLVFVVWMRC